MAFAIEFTVRGARKETRGRAAAITLAVARLAEVLRRDGGRHVRHERSAIASLR